MLTGAVAGFFLLVLIALAVFTVHQRHRIPFLKRYDWWLAEPGIALFAVVLWTPICVGYVTAALETNTSCGTLGDFLLFWFLLATGMAGTLLVIILLAVTTIFVLTTLHTVYEQSSNTFLDKIETTLDKIDDLPSWTPWAIILGISGLLVIGLGAAFGSIPVNCEEPSEDTIESVLEEHAPWLLEEYHKEQ